MDEDKDSSQSGPPSLAEWQEALAQQSARRRSARHSIYLALFPALRPGLCNIGKTKRQATLESGKQWEVLTKLPRLTTTCGWRAARLAAGVPQDAHFETAVSGIIAWAKALQASTKREPWSTPDTPKRWAKVFKVSVYTMKRWFKSGKVRNKPLSDRRYCVHLDELEGKTAK